MYLVKIINNFFHCIWILSNRPKPSPILGYLNHGAKNQSLLWEAVHRMFSWIPDIYPLNASRTLTVAATKNVTRHCWMSPGIKIVPGWEPMPCTQIVERFIHVFFWRVYGFVLSAFRSLLHLEFILIYDVRCWSNFSKWLFSCPIITY